MQRFIIGTGRCGSTLLSTLMAYHPDALVLSEFLASIDVVDNFRDGQVSGGELAAMLLQDHEISNLNRLRAKVDREILIDVGKYSSVRIPGILLVALPALTDDPEALMREIVGWAGARASATIGEHYNDLIEWLTRLFKKEFWIERSGASAEFFQGMRRTFPDARYLHIHRDGAEAALSMSVMHHFETHVSFYYDPPTDQEVARAIRREDMDEDGGLILRRHKNNRPVEDFGTFWTMSIATLMSEVQYLNRDQYGDFWFEDLHADPRAFLKRVCDFFQISSDDSWIGEAIKAMRPEKNQRAAALDPDMRARLEEAIFPGQVLLHRAGTDRANRMLHQRIRNIWDGIDAGKAFAA